MYCHDNAELSPVDLIMTKNFNAGAQKDSASVSFRNFLALQSQQVTWCLYLSSG